MSFSTFNSIDQVLAKYPLKIEMKYFLSAVETELPDHLLENLRFSLEMGATPENAAYLAENFIYPLLHQAWKQHRKLKLWSHRAIQYNEELFGEPDYLIAARPEGITHKQMVQPMLAVVEAKKEDFEKGWGQCLIAMLACQKINGDENLPLYGIVSAGLGWQFGKLEGQTLMQDPSLYSLSTPQRVYGLIEQLFAECEGNLIQMRSPAAA